MKKKEIIERLDNHEKHISNTYTMRYVDEVVNGLQKQINSIRVDSSNIRPQIKHNSKRIEEIAANDANCRAIIMENTGLNQHVSELEKEIKSLSDKVDLLSVERLKLMKLGEENALIIEEKDQAINALKDENQRLQSKINSFKAHIVNVESDLAEEKKRVEELVSNLPVKMTTLTHDDSLILTIYPKKGEKFTKTQWSACGGLQIIIDPE